MANLLVSGFNGFGQFSSILKKHDFKNIEVFKEFTEVDLPKCLEQDTIPKSSDNKNLEQQETNETNDTRLDLNKSRNNLFNEEINNKKIDKIIKSDVKQEINYDDVIISCAWNYVIYAFPRFLIIKGLLSGNINYQRTLDLNDLLDENDAIKYVSTCDYLCLVLTIYGKVFKFLPDTESIPEQMEFYYDSGELAIIDFICCGNNILTAITNHNITFYQQKEIYQLPFDFIPKQFECGFEHALLLGYNGDMYTWGNGIRGQLGSGTLERRSTPYLVEALAGIKILTISAGGWQSAAISIFGDIYTWGFNKFDQLEVEVYEVAGRLHQPAVHDLPTLIDLPMDCCSRRDTENMDFSIEEACVPVKVAVGARHIAVLTTCGTIYTCGCNNYGQLALPETKGQRNFKIAKILKINKNLLIDNIDLQAQCWNTLIRIYKPEKKVC